MLQNPGHPGATYRFLTFTGGPEAEVNVNLPAPATLNDSYVIGIESLINDFSLMSLGTATGVARVQFSSPQPSQSEASFEDAVISLIQNPSFALSYRMDVLVKPDGVWRNPGYSAQ